MTKKSAKFRGRVFYLSDRDIKILTFLWRWKLASTATLHQAAGRPGSTYSTFKAMERLAKHGYVSVVTSEQYRFTAWQLSDRGYESIKLSLGEFEEDGYLSENPWHDRNVLAFHLGEWAWHQIPVVQLFTEQEMRRRPLDYYPSWVPTIPGHRADGYTRIEGEKRTWIFAYEAEVTLKSLQRYESVVRYYRAINQVDRVFWLVGDDAIKDAIARARVSMNDAKDSYHVFVDLVEYQKVGWDAQITNERSKSLYTIREYILGILGERYGEYIGTAKGESMVADHYDRFRVLGKSRACRTPPNGASF